MGETPLLDNNFVKKYVCRSATHEDTKHITCHKKALKKQADGKKKNIIRLKNEKEETRSSNRQRSKRNKHNASCVSFMSILFSAFPQFVESALSRSSSNFASAGPSSAQLSLSNFGRPPPPHLCSSHYLNISLLLLAAGQPAIFLFC